MSLVDVKMDPKGEKNGICMYLLMEMLKWSWFSGRWWKMIAFFWRQAYSLIKGSCSISMIGGRLVLGPRGSEFKSNQGFYTKTRNPARFLNNPVSNHKFTNDHKIHTKAIWMAQFVTGLWGSKLKEICLTRRTPGITAPTIPTTYTIPTLLLLLLV